MNNNANNNSDLDKYFKLSRQNDEYAKIISNIKLTNEALDKSELILRQKLDFKLSELSELRKSHNDMLELYSHASALNYASIKK